MKGTYSGFRICWEKRGSPCSQHSNWTGLSCHTGGRTSGGTQATCSPHLRHPPSTVSLQITLGSQRLKLSEEHSSLQCVAQPAAIWILSNKSCCLMQADLQALSTPHGWPVMHSPAGQVGQQIQSISEVTFAQHHVSALSTDTCVGFMSVGVIKSISTE